MYDLKIVGGTVVDGTGSERYPADIGIKDRQIVEMRRRGSDDAPLAGDAAQTIDATGHIVAPGFVDIHTHYDGQVSWDSLLEPSSGHGVTTLVTGNCGVGFAPVRPGREDWLIGLMEGVEDIPGQRAHRGHLLGLGELPRVPRRDREAEIRRRRGQSGGPRCGPRVCDGRPRRPQRARHDRRHRGDEPAGAGGRRGRCARLLDVTHDRPPRHGRRARSRNLCRRGRTVRPGPGHGGRRPSRLRAGPAGRCRRGHRRAQEGTGVDAAPRR